MVYWIYIAIFKGGLISMLDVGERAEADGGYYGKPFSIQIPIKSLGVGSLESQWTYLRRKYFYECTTRQ